MKKTSASKVSHKALSVLMSVVLAVGLMPLPAYAELAPGSADLGAGSAVSDDAASASAIEPASVGGAPAAASFEQSAPEPSANADAGAPLAAQGNWQNNGIDTVDDWGDYVVSEYGTDGKVSRRTTYRYKITNAFEGQKTVEIIQVMVKDVAWNTVVEGDVTKEVDTEVAPANGSVDLVIPKTIQSENTHANFTVAAVKTVGDTFCKSITIPNTVTSVGTMSFGRGYYYIKSIRFEEGSKVTELPMHFADGCILLDTVVLPEGLKKIGAFAFDRCDSLKAVELPSTLEEIGDYAFYNAGLSKVSASGQVAENGKALFPAGLKSIGKGAFSWHPAMTHYTQDPDGISTPPSVHYGGIQFQAVVIPDSVTSIGAAAFTRVDGATHYSGHYYDTDKWTYLSLPEEGPGGQTPVAISSITLGRGLETIGEGAFYGCAATDVTLPASLMTIGPNAFACSPIESVKWADFSNSQLETLDGFQYCRELTAFDIPASTKTIAADAFTSAEKLSAITIPARVSSIGDGAFSGSGIKTLTIIPGSVPLSIERAAFSGCAGLSGATVTLPARVASLAISAFVGVEATFRVFNDSLVLKAVSTYGGIGTTRLVVNTADIPGEIRNDDLYSVTQDTEDETKSYISIPDPWNGSKCTVCYPDTLTKDTSFTFWAYVNAESAGSGSTARPTFEPFDLMVAEEPIDTLGGPGKLAVMTDGPAGATAYVCVFDAQGKLASHTQASAGLATITGLDAGTYTVVAFARNDRFSTVGSLGDFAAMNIGDAYYAKKENVVVPADGAEVEIALTVPVLPEESLGTIIKKASVSIGKEDVLLGSEAYALCSFQLKDKNRTASALKVKVPVGLTPTTATSATNVYAATFDSSTRLLTVNLTGNETRNGETARVWVGFKPSAPGRYSLNASVVAEGTTAPVGSASFNCAALSLEVPSEPISRTERKFDVTVHAAPKSQVQVEVANNVYTLTTNAGGTCTKEVEARETANNGIALGAESYTVLASYDYGAYTYTDSKQVYLQSAEDDQPVLREFSFVHAGERYYLVRDGKREPKSSYYIYVANGKPANEYWTFDAVYDSKRPLAGNATVQVQMLNGSSRYEKMGRLSSAIDNMPPYSGSYKTRYATTIRINQAGDHVFPSSLVPTAFDVFYAYEPGTVKFGQDDVNFIKQKWQIAAPQLRVAAPVSANAQNRTNAAVDTLFASWGNEARDAVKNANMGIAMFSTIDDYSASVDTSALRYYLEAIWNLAKTDNDFKQALERIPNDGVDSIDTTNQDRGIDEVSRIVCGGVPETGTGKLGQIGGIVGVFDDLAQLMYNKEYTGWDKSPREVGATAQSTSDASNFAEEFIKANYKPDNPIDVGTIDWDNLTGWDVFGDSDPAGTPGVGTPQGGNVASGDLSAPGKFGLHVNKDSSGCPTSFEYVDSNGNHYEAKVPGVMQQAWKNSDMVEGMLKSLGNDFLDFAGNNDLAGKAKEAAKNLSPQLAAAEYLVKNREEIAKKAKQLAKDGLNIAEDAAEKIAKAPGEYFDAQMELVANSQALYDLMKEKLRGYDWQDVKNAVKDKAQKAWEAKKRAVEYAKNAALSLRCKETAQKIADAYLDLLNWEKDLASELFTKFSQDMLYTGLGMLVAEPGSAVTGYEKRSGLDDVKLFQNIQGLFNYGSGAAKSALKKNAGKAANQVANFLLDLLVDCDDNAKNATYNKRVILDPSGTVYEAGTGAPLSGVTATVYELDEHGGFKLDGEKRIPWEADEYDQSNPLTTGASGSFGWDVPPGKWIVVFEKEGYETYTTNVMDVPPPQLDLEIFMYPNGAPQVESISATVGSGSKAGYIEIVFSQVMNTLGSGSVYVNGEYAEETWPTDAPGYSTGKNEYGVYEYAKVLRVPLPAGAKLGDTVQVAVSGYSSARGSEYQVTATTQDVTVSVLPASLSVNGGRDVSLKAGTAGSATVVVKDAAGGPVSGAIIDATIDNTYLAQVNAEPRSIVTDANGEATIPIEGVLPGMCTLTASVFGTMLTQSVPLQTTIDTNQVARPTAEIDDVFIGEGGPRDNELTVPKDSQLVLECATEGATIYYTTDGSCPCDDTGGRIAYSGPITVTQDTTFRIGAVKEGMTDSERYVLKVNIAKADKSVLNTYIHGATTESRYTDAKVSAAGDGSDIAKTDVWVTAKVKADFDAALANAQAVAADDNATEAQIKAAVDQMEAAMAAWGDPKYGTKSDEPAPGPDPGPQPQVKTDISGAAIAPVPTQTYTSYRIEPALTVSLDGKNLAKGTDFTVTYDKNIEVGTATVTITGIGLYEGTKSTTFKIEHRDPTTMFSDLDANGWYLEAKPGSGSFAGAPSTLYLDYILARGIMSGYAGTTLFGPDDSVSRAQVAVILYRADQNKTAETTDNKVKPVFVDCGYDQYYSRAVQWAYENKIVTGYTDGSNRFGPNDPVTREQLATMIHRFAVTYRHTQDASKDLGYYVDAGTVAPYAVAAMRYNVAIGAMGAGGNRLNPQDGASRVQTAKIVAVVLHDVVGM